jgi:ribosome-associated protein
VEVNVDGQVFLSSRGAGGRDNTPKLGKLSDLMNNPKTRSESADAILSEPSAKVFRSPAVTDRSRQLAAAAARTAIANNGSDVLVLDVCEQTALFDYFVIATGTSRRQLHAISEEIDDVLQKDLGDTRLGIEGYEDSRWIVLDYGSVMIHLFDEEARAYYDLESLWADAKVVPLADLGLSQAELSPRPKRNADS